eukprot:SAG31_NODE_2763_length_5128_cov_25.339232_5_plen_184_part_00
MARRCATRCLAFINVGNHGLASMAYGHPEQLQTAPTIARIEKYRDTVVGVKLLLTASYANDGQTEYTAYQRALEVSAAVGLPLMTHHSSSIIPLDHTAPRLEQHELSGCDLGCPSSLRPGDICASHTKRRSYHVYTAHIYTGYILGTTHHMYISHALDLFSQTPTVSMDSNPPSLTVARASRA